MLIYPHRFTSSTTLYQHFQSMTQPTVNNSDISLHEIQIKSPQRHEATISITLLKDSIYIYIGSSTNQFTSLALSTLSRNPRHASSTSLLSHGIDDCSERMAKKMSLKYKRQVLFSFNGDEYDDTFVRFCEAELVKFIDGLID